MAEHNSSDIIEQKNNSSDTIGHQQKINWSDIIGHKQKIAQIRDMIRSQQFPNAVIFSGIEGIGKRLIAEVTAKALLCENEDSPCGHCDSCRAFSAASHPDYYYMEPDRSKVNPIIKIDQVRALQKEVAMMPVMSSRRMVIINDSECMNTAAQNCLLKTIEEPSGLSKFILITANRSRLLMTLLSRCMIINFEKLSEVEIKRGLETQDIDNAAKIAVVANGSLGQAINLAKNDGLQIREDSLQFLESLSKLTVEDIFNKGQALSTLPKDHFREWTINFQKFLRDLLIISKNLDENYYYNRDLISRIAKLHTQFKDSVIFDMLHEIAEVQRRLNSNANLELLIESFFIRLKRSL